VYVVGLDEHNLQVLQTMPDAHRYAFHGVLGFDELFAGDEIPVAELLEKATATLQAANTPIDAIVGYWDFPVSSMVPMLAERFGVRSASLEAVLKCEHKYWSRLEQSGAIDEYPAFGLVDLDNPRIPSGVDFPFWLKPVKSVSSQLAFRVEDRESFDAAVAETRKGIGRIGEPFEFVLEQVDLPPEVAAAGGSTCLAEAEASGEQVTVEGYRSNGEVHICGIVDSIRYPGRSSFLRYRYPSTVPEPVADRLSAITKRVISHVGLESVPFNIEFFWDPDSEAIRLLEINPRHSQSHAWLFEHVDGVPNHACMVELALGLEPSMSHRQGGYAVAAKWFLRRFSDGFVRRAPTADEVAALEREMPGTAIEVVAHQGDRFSRLAGHGSYSYELARIHTGAQDEEELAAKYEHCVQALPFEVQE
jgi:hypothetical protein